ncbi:MAG: hypothetical protein OEV25_16455 [Deltaproteobacteria bacterium]|jgi:hypothetical protein|nr:hypothetical protein [Deltaproteobacteria bacterium]MDH3965003.1 hypothetical protein [Deltaproteobacteria bacterium]
MNKKQYSLMLVLALVAGLVGGVVSSQFFMGQPAFAEKKSNPMKVVESEEFRLVDKDGKTRAFLGFGHSPINRGQPRFELHGKEGFPLAVLGVSSLMTEQERMEGERSQRHPRRPIFSLVLFNEKGKVIWRVP